MMGVTGPLIPISPIIPIIPMIPINPLNGQLSIVNRQLANPLQAGRVLL